MFYNLSSAACHLKSKNYEKAVSVCDEALEISENVKAYFRRGQAFHGLREYQKSVSDLKKALQLAPNDRAIMAELVAVRGEVQAYHNKEKETFAKMFS